MNKFLRKLAYAAIIFTGTAQANDAVETTSISAIGSYSTNLNNHKEGEFNNYDARINFTAPINNTKYLGLNVFGEANRTKNRYSYYVPDMGYSSGVNTGKQLSVGLDLFLRDPEIGGLLAGYSYLHHDYNADTNFFGSNWHDSGDGHVQYRTLKGEYYFDRVTVSARHWDSTPSTCCDQSERSISGKWYPTDKYILAATVINKKYDNPLFNIGPEHIYNIGAQAQPEYFDDKIRVNLNHAWFAGSSMRSTSVGASYYFPQYKAYNSTPVIGLTYTYSNLPANLNGSDAQSIMLQFGFMFDNRISLKDRDRKYLFSSGY